VTLEAIYTSPLERAIETAEAISQSCGLKPIVREELTEFDFGEWEGRSIESLRGDNAWEQFNRSRSTVVPPGGERMIEVQARMVRESDKIRRNHPNGAAVVVSHGDPLRSLIAYYLGAPLDLMQRMEVSTASITAVRFYGEEPVVLHLNHTGELEP